jgi:signal peptidase I
LTPKTKNNDLIKSILIAIFAALILRQFVIAAYKIPTASMENTLLVGDFLLVNKFVYGAQTPEWVGIPFTRIGSNIPSFRFPNITKPKPYDIVVFKYPKDPYLDYIKRCIAAGGQTVESRNKRIFLDGYPFPIPPKIKYIDRRIFQKQYYDDTMFEGNRDNFGPIRVPRNHYFVMGDNRDNSLDSRYWGFVPPENMVGRPLIIYLSLDPSESTLNLFSKIRWNRLGKVIR